MELRRLSLLAPVLIAGMLLSLPACQQQAPQRPDTRAADEQAIRTIQQDWFQAWKSNDLEGQVAQYTDDAVSCPPNIAALKGKDAIRAAMKGGLPVSNPDGTIQTVKVEFSAGGDLATSRDAYSLAWTDAQGKHFAVTGNSVSVYRKQTDGKWKVVLDIWNSDQPEAKK